MGTTIHAHIEVKKDGRWFHYGCPNVDRNYLVFACINWERRDTFEDVPELYKEIPSIARIHKIPDDISEVTRICLEDDRQNYKLHGYGVLEAKDIERLQKELYRLYRLSTTLDMNYDLETDYDMETGIFKTYICGNSIAMHDNFDDVRIVYWFDN